MEDVLEQCLDSSDGESYNSSNKDLFIVSSITSSQSVNDAQKDGYNDGTISNVLNLLVPVLLVVIHRLVLHDLCWSSYTIIFIKKACCG